MSIASVDGAAKLGRLLPGKPWRRRTARLTARPDSHNCAPTWRAKDVGGNDTYGVTGIPSMVGGREVVQRAGLTGSRGIIYPGSGREDA